MKHQELFESIVGNSLNGRDVIDVTDTSDFPRYIERYFQNPSYFIRDKNIKIEVVDMRVGDYIRKAKQLLTRSYGTQTLSRTSTSTGRDKISLYAEKMKSGERFPLPYLNYIDNTQQGLHRAEAALLAGVRNIPVAIINNAREIPEE